MGFSVCIKRLKMRLGTVHDLGKMLYYVSEIKQITNHHMKGDPQL